MVPETRHIRDLDLSQTSETLNFSEKNTAIDTVEYSAATNEVPTYTPKQSYLRTLNPWSGITPGHSFWNIFIRPFPLGAYPAVFWGFLSCKYSRYCLQFHEHLLITRFVRLRLPCLGHCSRIRVFIRA